MSLSGALAPFHSCGALGPAADDNAFITDSLAAQRPARDAAGWGARLPLTLQCVCVCVCVCVRERELLLLFSFSSPSLSPLVPLHLSPAVRYLSIAKVALEEERRCILKGGYRFNVHTDAEEGGNAWRRVRGRGGGGGGRSTSSSSPLFPWRGSEAKPAGTAAAAAAQR